MDNDAKSLLWLHALLKTAAMSFSGIYCPVLLHLLHVSSMHTHDCGECAAFNVYFYISVTHLVSDSNNCSKGCRFVYSVQQLKG